MWYPNRTVLFYLLIMSYYKSLIIRNTIYLQLRSMVTALDIGVIRLLLEAWHVNTMCRWRRSTRSRLRTFLTLLWDRISRESSSRAFSCHHVTLGSGLPKASYEVRTHSLLPLLHTSLGFSVANSTPATKYSRINPV